MGGAFLGGLCMNTCFIWVFWKINFPYNAESYSSTEKHGGFRWRIQTQVVASLNSRRCSKRSSSGKQKKTRFFLNCIIYKLAGLVGDSVYLYIISTLISYFLSDTKFRNKRWNELWGRTTNWVPTVYKAPQGRFGKIPFNFHVLFWVANVKMSRCYEG